VGRVVRRKSAKLVSAGQYRDGAPVQWARSSVGKTLPSHGRVAGSSPAVSTKQSGIMGSNPIQEPGIAGPVRLAVNRPTFSVWVYGSIGTALALQASICRFDSGYIHQFIYAFCGRTYANCVGTLQRVQSAVASFYGCAVKIVHAARRTFTGWSFRWIGHDSPKVKTRVQVPPGPPFHIPVAERTIAPIF
jgi:hypothetical protein